MWSVKILLRITLPIAWESRNHSFQSVNQNRIESLRVVTVGRSIYLKVHLFVLRGTRVGYDAEPYTLNFVVGEFQANTIAIDDELVVLQVDGSSLKSAERNRDLTSITD